MRPLDEQTILITGATDGLGRALATELAAAGATLLIHGRDDARGQRVIDDIASSTGSRRLHWLRADFASLDEVAAWPIAWQPSTRRSERWLTTPASASPATATTAGWKAGTGTNSGSPSTTSPGTC